MRNYAGLIGGGLAEPSNGARLTGRRLIQRRSGGSVTELMVVIAITGILALTMGLLFLS